MREYVSVRECVCVCDGVCVRTCVIALVYMYLRTCMRVCVGSYKPNTRFLAGVIHTCIPLINVGQ